MAFATTAAFFACTGNFPPFFFLMSHSPRRWYISDGVYFPMPRAICVWRAFGAPAFEGVALEGPAAAALGAGGTTGAAALGAGFGAMFTAGGEGRG